MDESARELYILNLMKSVTLNYLDNEGDEIEIDSDDSLLSSLRTVKISGLGKILKIKI